MQQDVNELRNQVQDFGHHMLDVLTEPQNMAKRHWGDCDMNYLLSKIKEHVRDLDDPTVDPLRKLRKFIHVSNFCMMGFDKTFSSLPENPPTHAGLGKAKGE